MWKIQDFCVTQIFREIIFAKTAIVTHLKAMNFNSYIFLHFLKVEIYQISNIESLKKGSFGTSKIPKIDFT